MSQKGSDVAGIHHARVIRHAIGQVDRSDDSYVVLDYRLASFLISQLPPRSAAKSTITDPGAIPFTISSVTSTGDFFPGITAAAITTSLSCTTFPSNSR